MSSQPLTRTNMPQGHSADRLRPGRVTAFAALLALLMLPVMFESFVMARDLYAQAPELLTHSALGSVAAALVPFPTFIAFAYLSIDSLGWGSRRVHTGAVARTFAVLSRIAYVQIAVLLLVPLALGLIEGTYHPGVIAMQVAGTLLYLLLANLCRYVAGLLETR